MKRAAIAFALLAVAWIIARAYGRLLRMRRPGLPPPDRAARRDVYNLE